MSYSVLIMKLKDHESNEAAHKFADHHIAAKMRKNYQPETKTGKRKSTTSKVATASAPASAAVIPAKKQKKTAATPSSARTAAAGPVSKPGAPNAATLLGIVDPVSGLSITGCVLNVRRNECDMLTARSCTARCTTTCSTNSTSRRTPTSTRRSMRAAMLPCSHPRYYIAQVIQNNGTDEYFCLTHWVRCLAAWPSHMVVAYGC